MYIDLNWEVKTNAEFRYKLKAITDDIKRLEKENDGDPHCGDKIANRIIDIYRLCKYNAGLLVPYFFPQYPYDKPLSCSARPYSFAMFHMQIGGFLSIRAGRQIGKSTSFGARQLIYAHIMRKRRSMYIVPHQSFLDTYANRLREMERAFRFYQVHKDYRQNLKYKEYPNESVTMLVKCLTDTQEARSKTTDEALFDESVHMNTSIPVHEGGKITLRHISSVLVGEKVLAYDSSGCIKPAYVRENRNKGIKNVWKLKFSNGAELICTGNTRFWTNKGWMFLSEFLSWEEAARGDNTLKAKTLLAIREAVNPGDSSWRRLHAMGREISRAHRIQSWQGPGSILQTQSKSSGQLREVSTENCAEWRLGRGELPLRDSDYSSVQFYVCPGLPPGFYKYPETGQDGYTGMGGSIDLGGDSLVVPGRRDTDSSWGSTYQHTQLSGGTSSDFGGCSHEARSASESSASQEGDENLFYYSNRFRSDTQIHRESETLCSRIYDVQSEFTGSDISEMSFLRCSLFEEGGPAAGYSRVRGLYVPKESCNAQKQEVCQKARRSETLQTKAEFQPKVSGAAKSEASKKERYKEGGDKCLLSSLVRKKEIGKIEPVNLLSIEYAGIEEVWDIDVEEYHTFFANGIAIHNCQLLDPDFLPDIEQCQKASRMPATIYAGTSTTTDSLLETKFLESSQSAWLIKAPGYHSASAGHGWLNCSDKDDVLKAIQPQGITNPATGHVLDVTDGRFVHQIQSNFEQGYLGFHIPQIIIPDYANIPQKWMEIWNAFQSYDIKKFLQEILGIPTEEGMREITMQDLKNICVLPELPETLKSLSGPTQGRYKYTVSGCDWGGSDYNPATKTKVSFTVHVILGICWDGSIEIIHMRQYAGMDYRSIANQICEDHKAYNCIGIASDFGVGAAYNMLLRENPIIRPERHFIFGYVGPQSALIKAPASGGWFNQYSLNRTESITSLYQAIKNRRFRCYAWELAQDRLLELLNLYRVPTETVGGNSGFRYQRHGAKADDTLHAINFAYCLARIILNEPILEDPALSHLFSETFNTQKSAMFFNPHGGFDLGGTISG